jgi:hypothetical protein
MQKKRKKGKERRIKERKSKLPAIVCISLFAL